MIEPVQIASGVLVLQVGGYNSGIIPGEGGAMLVDPAVQPGGSDLFERYGNVRVVVFTGDYPADIVDLSSWPSASHLFPGDFVPSGDRGLPWAGWDLLPLSGRHLLVYSPADRVLFCGDMLPDSGVPSLTEGSQPYLDALAKVESLEVRLLVPQSGEVAQGKRALQARIEKDKNYIYSLQRHITTSLAARIPLDRALQAAGSVYEDYPFVETHLRNLRSVWDEMLKGKTAG
ncbi:MAG: hypothetical protein IVW55_04485 [Chloroflexi bacterium]|nr:hypothetical protein [Chloroflexota bacterium]